MKIATLGNASVIHTRRWAEYFRGRGHDVRVWSLEPPAPGFEATVLPHPPLPGFLRYPLATPALGAEERGFPVRWLSPEHARAPGRWLASLQAWRRRRRPRGRAEGTAGLRSNAPNAP